MTDETDLPPGWAWDTLGAICGAVAQVTPGDIFTDEFTYLDISSIDNEGYRLKDPKQIRVSDAPSRARQLVLQGDVLFSTVRTYLKNIAYVDERFDGKIASTGFCVLRPADRIEGRYIYYYTLTRNFIDKVSALQRGVSYPAVRDVDVQAQSIPVAPAAEQRRIVEKIDELFSLIEAGEQALARARRLLERYRQSVLNAAVTGELTKEWRERHQGDIESGEDLLKRILKARREAWEKAELAKMRARGKPPTDDRWKQKYREPQPPDTSTLPDLPEGWVWATLEMLTDGHEGNGISIKGSDNPPGTPALRLDSVRNGAIDFSVRRYIPLPLNRVSRYEVVPGDFLISRANGSKHLLACAALVTREPAQCVFPDTIIRFRAIDGVLLGQWLQSIWPSRLVRNQIEARGKTSAGIWKVSQEDLRRVHVPLPSPAERAFIIDAVETSEWDGVELSCELEVITRRAAALRQSILAAAFSGKLVPQDPADEPASVLLARIRAERAQPAAKPPKRPGAGHRQRKTPQLALPIEERQT